MFCPSCATENQTEQKYCRHCGQQLTSLQLALEGRVDEAVKTLKIGEKTPQRVKYVLLAIALLLLSPIMIRALRTGAPLTFLFTPVWGLLLGLLIGLSKRAFKLRRIERLLNATVEFKSLKTNGAANPDLMMGHSSKAKPPVPVSVTENTTLELKSTQKVQK